MAKVPVAGRVKTRLARGIGVVGATSFFRRTAAAVLGRIGSSPHWRAILTVSPDREARTRIFPRHIARMPQGGGDLGARLWRPVDVLPPGPVVIVGLDIPGMDVAPIRRAFELLGRHDVVLGPADDGGYWLVGFRRRPKAVNPFAGVRWSTEHALADTLANVGPHSFALTATLSDVDEARDLAKLAHEPGRRIIPAPVGPQRRRD
jgi:hypothetical protein